MNTEVTASGAAPEAPTALPILTEADIITITAKELENAIQKLHSGGSLTSYERELIKAAAARGKAPAPARNTSPASSGAPAAAPVATADETRPLTRQEIAALYLDENGVPLSLRTIDRVNLISSLPDCGVAAPWRDPRALAGWFQAHYRSDPSKPAPLKARALPAWLERAVARAVPAQTPLIPGPAESAAPSPAPFPAAPSAPTAGPEEPLLMPLAFARQLEAEAQRKWQQVKGTDQEPSARRSYMDTLEKLQQAEERARKAGNTDDLRRDLVAAHLETLHSRIRRRLILDFTGVRVEAMRATATPETWSAWVKTNIDTICRRMVESRFAADIASLQESAPAAAASPTTAAA